MLEDKTGKEGKKEIGDRKTSARSSVQSRRAAFHGSTSCKIFAIETRVCRVPRVKTVVHMYVHQLYLNACVPACLLAGIVLLAKYLFVSS